MSGATFSIVARCEIDRPIDVVRQQFADVDHAIRDGLHRDLTMKWLPPTPGGERRLSHRLRLLGQHYDDEVTFEVAPDGAITRTIVAGPNEGGEFRETFEALGDRRTRATLTVRIPATAARRVVAPLFRIALRLALERMLLEHKTDIEGGYEPGRARGNLSAALEELQPFVERVRACSTDAERVAMVAPLLECACVIAVADNEVDDAERDAIRSVLGALGVRALDGDALEAIIASSTDRTRRDGIAARCRELGTKLPSLGAVEPGLAIATLVAQVSHGLDQRELEALQALAHAAGVDDDALANLVDRIDRKL